MDQQQPHIDPQQPQAQTQPPPPPGRKRKKAENGEPSTPAEPRRLRRSHEACARCRSKKIKCDSKHPRCTACATAGTPCHQEDRHRQTLTLRGHTEHLEQKLAQCDAILKRRIPGFELENLEEILVREGVEVEANVPPISASFQFTPGPAISPPKGYPYAPPGPHMIPPGYPPMPPYYPAPPNGAPYPPPPHMQPHPGYNPHLHPMFQHPPQPIPPQHLPPAQSVPRPMSSNGPVPDIKGGDPGFHDMSNPRALAKSFGVAPDIVQDLKLGPQPLDKEDIAVGSHGLISGRDSIAAESTFPHDANKWVLVPMRRDSVASSPSAPGPTHTFSAFLPKDRVMVQHIVHIYFERLNFHRPVFLRHEFEVTLAQLYAGESQQHDPGFLCSVYLIFALGTLSELNHRAYGLDREAKNKATAGGTPSLANVNVKTLMPPDWPDHEDFFQRALSIKPELRVTISSLQALILLHWYLYTERQGRTLWRLVGSMVRLGIELGLNHDPTTQTIFDESECQLRIRLWGIVLVHDRGTSLLLGRPLAIAPYDTNTPHPVRPKSTPPDLSEHFLLSHPIAEIQADIINSLYSPHGQSGDAIMRHATRIVKSMVEFRRHLPEKYKRYFGGTVDWSLEEKTKLVQGITEDEGLTLLKIGIARILLLRALFSNKDLDFPQRHKALLDAIVVSHNIIVVHNQLLRFPDISFFVSPIPLHIAAMVILFGHMSRCDSLTRQVALEDVWMALDMLPSFRWRWERKETNGSHPLIATLAEKVLEVNLRQVGPSSHPVLMPELDWDLEGTGSPLATHTAASTPSLTSTNINYAHGAPGTPSFPGSPPIGPAVPPSSRILVPGPGNGGGGGGGGGGGSNGPVETKLAEVPPNLFYPFYPTVDGRNGGAIPPSGSANAVAAAAAAAAAAGNGNGSNDYTQLLAQAAAAAAQQTAGPWGASGPENYMLEEKDVGVPVPNTMWVPDQRAMMRGYVMGP
ncbi:fungal-specific transcription factor domain-containing protein [Lactarius akahatsu]|uniref:Fungal-specific transcription factor domain-containing protein n=1 Tax=Lactarius akahatsu TaxID=416441 RepID=A0AAD4LMT9_9AGAM|nr:fungal-specific transcription factor domain-containing protein [Lactarius akahatsu]